MKRIKSLVTTVLVVLFFHVQGEAQKLMGVVSHTDDRGLEQAVAGANVHWLGTNVATTTAENGVFVIDRTPDANRLVISFTGLRSDTILIADEKSIQVALQPERVLETVTVEGWKPTSGIDHARGINTTVMMEEELFKAACCNLSESFETNPSVDVSFTDALTGTRQIQMLGLTGPNTMILVENLPGVRGLAGSQGIQFIPGSWINAIEVTKGTGPVVNGYESIAGQINVELKKPHESDKLFVNGYVNQSGRSEANANFTFMAGKKWATTFLFHGSARPFEMDQNEDGFLDFPTGTQLNVMNRWVFNSGTGWLAQFGVRALRDTKLGGQSGFSAQDKFTTTRYGLEINTTRIEAWGKVGYQFQGRPYKNIGLQVSATGHDHESYYGLNGHNANESAYHGKLTYQSVIASTKHKFKAGTSFLYDRYNERLESRMQSIRVVRPSGEEGYPAIDFDRTEIVPGAFFEYTYNHNDRISVIAGARVDHHNLFGTLFTPRLHTRFDAGETSTIRLSAGKGTRVANVLTENTNVLATARQIVFSDLQTSDAYGFRPDVAWNYGLNFSQDFNLNYRPGSLTLDYFFTDFKNQVVVDFDHSAREANFYSLRGKSFSHSLQVQVDYEVMRRFDLRLAYRLLDVKTDYRGGRLSRPLIARHRAFVNLAYQTRSNWSFDYTVQWLGKQRIPDTRMNPDGYRLGSFAPEYVIMNAQVTKDLKDRWSVYLGVENLTNFRLNDPIIASAEPFSPYFDSSLVWGPIFGRMTYLGFRYRIGG